MTENTNERKQTEDYLRSEQARVQAKLDAILAPEGDLGALELSGIIDVPAIQSMMNHFSAVINIGIAILDLRGSVLVATGWQDICTRFHRVHPESCRHCTESDTILSQGVKAGMFKVYKCKNNLWDMSTPIEVGGRHVGNLFVGQFFYDDEAPDVEFFRAQARKYGFDEQEYLAALEHVPRWNRQKVNEVMHFYAQFAGMISSLSYSRIQLARSLAARQRAEDLLIQAKDAAEAANRAKSEFLANMSHELRTPLNAILGFSELMTRNPELTSDQRENLAIINRSGAHLLGVINDVLDMAKIEAGRVTLREHGFDLHWLLAELAALFRLRTVAKGLGLSVSLGPDLPRFVRADEGKLRQILINLLSNAVKFTPAGSVTLSVHRLALPDTYRLIFAVQDTGIGIAAEHMLIIFDPFVQAVAGHTALEGTGLGLAISRQFARLMGGELTAASAGACGQGSLFQFEVPVGLGTEDELAGPQPRLPANLPAPASPLLQETPAKFDLVDLPARWIGQVRQAALAADAEKLLKLATQIANTHIVLANALRQWVDGYDYGAILAAVERSQVYDA